MSRQSLQQSPVYSNIKVLQTSAQTAPIIITTKQKSFSTNELNIDDLHLDPVIIRENHLIPELQTRKNEQTTVDISSKKDHELSYQDKESNMLSASRLRLLQDTTMIESALDLDSLDDSSIGTNSQAGLMKIGVI